LDNRKDITPVPAVARDSPSVAATGQPNLEQLLEKYTTYRKPRAAIAAATEILFTA